jgi:hypothetical protein
MLVDVAGFTGSWLYSKSHARLKKDRKVVNALCHFLFRRLICGGPSPPK